MDKGLPVGTDGIAKLGFKISGTSIPDSTYESLLQNSEATDEQTQFLSGKLSTAIEASEIEYYYGMSMNGGSDRICT